MVETVVLHITYYSGITFLLLAVSGFLLLVLLLLVRAILKSTGQERP